MFFKLHYEDGSEVYINMDHITDYRLVNKHDGFNDDAINRLTILHGEGEGWYLVTETPETISLMIRSAIRCSH